MRKTRTGTRLALALALGVALGIAPLGLAGCSSGDGEASHEEQTEQEAAPAEDQDTVEVADEEPEPQGAWVLSKETKVQEGTYIDENGEEVPYSTTTVTERKLNDRGGWVGYLITDTYADGTVAVNESTDTLDDAGYELSSEGAWYLQDDPDGEDREEYSYNNEVEYDDEGRPTKSVDSDGMLTYTYEYDDEGNISRRTSVEKQTYTNDDGSEGSTVVTYVADYNEWGLATALTVTVEDSNGTTDTYVDTYEYEYDDEGRPVSCSFVGTINDADNGSGEETFTFDENGNITQLVNKSVNGDSSSTTTITREFTYVEDPVFWSVARGHLVRTFD